MFYQSWLHKVGTLLVVGGLVLSLSTSAFAQSEAVDVDPASAEQADPNASLWAESVDEEAVESKPEQDVVMPADDKENGAAGNENRVYLPAVMTSGNGGAVNAASIPTYTILQEGFEGTWPAGLWKVKNTTGGTVVWDDVNFQHHSGNWSAQPADSTSYPNNLSTYMQYGPFSLPSADVASAKFSFYYSLNSEVGHDFFTWGYSCNNGLTWADTVTSGSSSGWKQGTVSLMPCLGKSKVLVHFIFTSDTSTRCVPICPSGVYVDDVFIYYTMIG